jgi:hypothetical protein
LQAAVQTGSGDCCTVGRERQRRHRSPLLTLLWKRTKKKVRDQLQ